MSNSGAVVGDKVIVMWPNDEQIEGTVKYIPQGEGDSWVIHTAGGVIWQVQRFDCIQVKERRAKEEPNA